MRIGIIGAGFAGRAISRLAMRLGYEVMLSNSRDPATLPTTMLTCKVGTNAEVAEFGEVVLLMLPFADHTSIAPELLAQKVVIDAIDHDQGLDGPDGRLDGGAPTSSELMAAHLKDARVVKALNAIAEKELERDGRASGTSGRRALPMAGDAGHAKEIVAAMLDRLGFDAVDAGPLREGWRFQPGQPAYGVPLDGDGLRLALAAAMRPGDGRQCPGEPEKTV